MSGSSATQNTEILPYPGQDSEGRRVESDEYDQKHFRGIYMLRKSLKTQFLAQSQNRNSISQAATKLVSSDQQ